MCKFSPTKVSEWEESVVTLLVDFHRKKSRVSEDSSSNENSSVVAQQQTEATPTRQPSPSPHRDLGVSRANSTTPTNFRLTPPPSSPGRYLTKPRPLQPRSPAQRVFTPHILTPSPLTMTQAADLAQMTENIDSSSSLYTPPSEITFMSPLPPSHQQSLFSNQRGTPSIYGGGTALFQGAGARSRRNLFLPLSQPQRTPAPSCSCSCHSRESTPLVSPSLSTSLLDSAPYQRYRSPTPRPRTASPSISSSLATHSELYYRLWTNSSSRPHLHLPHRHGASVSPV